MAVKIKDGQTILFIGDSITDCGRRDTERPLGNGYVKFFADLVTIREPGKKISIINKGIGGNKITDLQCRWSDDVLWHKINWLSIKIGINDLHATLNQAQDAVPPNIYESVYNDILVRTKRKFPKCRILLIDPFYINTEKSDNSFRKQVLELLPKYIRIVHYMSSKHKTRLVKTHEIFQKLLKSHEPDTFCPELVHPNLIGHLAIAEAVYAVLSK